MSNPVVRTFERNVEAQFPEEEAVPKNLREWWRETKTNLERLRDRTNLLEQEIESLKTKISSLENNTASNSQFTDAQADQLARFIQYWEITTSGGLVPYTNDVSDIGSAERKVRDIYESQT